MANMLEGGRDLEGTEPTEYCDSRLLDACDIGRVRDVDCDGGDATCGGRSRFSEVAAVPVSSCVAVARCEFVAMMTLNVGPLQLDWKCEWPLKRQWSFQDRSLHACSLVELSSKI